MSTKRRSTEKDPALYTAKLESSGIDAQAAKKLGYRHLSATETKAKGHREVQSMLIPYYDIDGSKARKFYRLRYLEGTKKGFAKQTNAKEQRYDQPAMAPEVYFPPLLPWRKYLDTREPLFITEGEYKAACATLRGYPCIALGGVWNFCSRKNGVQLLTIFDELKLEGRDVYIIYDSDSVSNPQVIMAENELCKQLTQKKARPLVVRLPNVGTDKKTGLDDYLLSEEADNFDTLLAEAQPYALAEHLLKLNEEVIYVENPSLVIRRKDGYKMGVPTFKNEVYAHKNFLDVSGEKPKKVQTAVEWMKWEGRAQVNGMTYKPGAPELVVSNGQTYINVWKPLPVQAIKGNIAPWKKLMDYVFAGKPEDRVWFERWLAYPLQHMGVKMFTAVAMWSVDTGTGKTLIGHTMQRIYGDNSIMVRKDDIVKGDNSFAENKQFVLGEEITGEEKRSVADNLKGLITNEEMRINIKYVPVYSILSCANYYFTSNNPDAFFLDEKDRRLFINEICGEPLPKEFYTQEYDPWYKSEEGINALYYYLMNLDLGDFDPRDKAPMTAAKEDMIENSRSALASWVHKFRENPAEVLGTVPYTMFTSEELLALFDPEGKTRVGVKGIGVELKRARVLRAAQGMGCRTAHGQVRLWCVKGAEHLVNANPREVAKLYDAERALADKPKKFSKESREKGKLPTGKKK